jgi:hypothetical protein
MAYGVGLIFDQQTDATIREVWQTLHDRGIVTPLVVPGSLPHISLILSEALRVDEALERIAETARTLPRLEIRFSTVGVFTHPDLVLFYGITPTAELIRFHAALKQAYRQCTAALITASQPGVWVPHCSLTGRLDSSQVQDGIMVAAETPLPFVTQHIELAVVEFDRSGVKMLKVIRVGA